MRTRIGRCAFLIPGRLRAIMVRGHDGVRHTTAVTTTLPSTIIRVRSTSTSTDGQRRSGSFTLRHRLTAMNVTLHHTHDSEEQLAYKAFQAAFFILYCPFLDRLLVDAVQRSELFYCPMARLELEDQKLFFKRVELFLIFFHPSVSTFTRAAFRGFRPFGTSYWSVFSRVFFYRFIQRSFAQRLWQGYLVDGLI